MPQKAPVSLVLPGYAQISVLIVLIDLLLDLVVVRDLFRII